MNTSLTNKLRLGRLTGACAVAAPISMGGDILTAGGIVAATFSAVGEKKE